VCTTAALLTICSHHPSAALPQVLARTVSLQLEGSWAAVAGVVVDKVGRYAYSAGGDPGAPAAPLIVDVSLDVRAKARPTPTRIHSCLTDVPACVTALHLSTSGVHAHLRNSDLNTHHMIHRLQLKCKCKTKDDAALLGGRC